MADILEKLNLTSDQKKQFHKMKHDLESFREVILIINSILRWDKKFYPGIIFGFVTFVYSLLWYLDFSVLTLIASFLLVLTVTDYAFPIVSKIVFKSENWSGFQEKKFEEICQDIVGIRSKTIAAYNTVFATKDDKSTMFTIFLVVGLLIVAWIGSTIDNLLLSYFVTLSLALYPGLNHNGFLDKALATASDLLGKHFRTLMSRNIKND